MPYPKGNGLFVRDAAKGKAELCDSITYFATTTKNWKRASHDGKSIYNTSEIGYDEADQSDFIGSGLPNEDGDWQVIVYQ